jgi:uncharacterized protein YcbK (DUF882 family)
MNILVNNREISRRGLLKVGVAAALSVMFPYRAIAEEVSDFFTGDRALCMYNLHTKEYVDIVFFKDGKYVKDALHELNHLFRDHYNGRERKIDRRLINYLYAIQRKLGTIEPVHLISGYRTAATNRMLRKRNSRVARQSLHVKGKAADIRISNNSLKDIRQAAYELKGGGVGYYPRSNFVHVDVGSVRYWRS